MQKVMLKDMVPVGSFGTTFLQIGDPKLFVIEIVGNLSRFTEEEVKNFIESFVIEKFIDTLADYTSFEVYRQTEETSTKIRAQLRFDMDRFGLEMVDMRIEGVTIDDDYKNKLFYLQRGVTAEQLVGKEVAEKFAEAIRDTKGGGAALGAGFMAIPYALQGATQMMTGPGAALIQCPNCGMQVQRNTKFCSNCGNPMGTVSAGIKCPKCGAAIPAGSKFCSSCGEKI
jgi:membrane protease subunit (stomatin/prohibitin family)